MLHKNIDISINMYIYMLSKMIEHFIFKGFQGCLKITKKNSQSPRFFLPRTENCSEPKRVTEIDKQCHDLQKLPWFHGSMQNGCISNMSFLSPMRVKKSTEPMDSWEKGAPFPWDFSFSMAEISRRLFLGSCLKDDHVHEQCHAPTGRYKVGVSDPVRT